MYKYLTLLFLTITFYSYSQSFSHVIETDTAYCNALNDIDHAYSNITNLTSETINLDIVRTEFRDAPDWHNGMCVDTICYFVSVDSVSMAIPPNETISFRSGFILTDINTDIIALASFEIRNQNDPDEIVSFKTFAVNQLTSSLKEQESLALEINIFPNPARDHITVDTEIELFLIEIFNFSGQCVLRTHHTNFNVSKLPSGNYISRLYSAKGIHTRHITLH